MPRWLQILLHAAAVAAGSYASYATGTPIPLVVTGGAQAVIGGIAQIYNTDGTHQSQPFTGGSNTPVGQ
jgi:hypothetical protein